MSKDDGHLIGKFPALPKQERAHQKREALMESGRFLFISKGYESTTAKEIAAHANVATGTFYRYFSDKRQLLMSLLEDQLEKIMPPEPTWMHGDPEYLLATLLAKHSEDLNKLGLHRVLPELLPHDPELAEVITNARLKMHLTMVEVLKQAHQESLTWADLDLDSVSWAIIAVLEKLPQKEAESGSKADYEKIAKVICRMIFPPEIIEQLQSGEKTL